MTEIVLNDADRELCKFTAELLMALDVPRRERIGERILNIATTSRGITPAPTR